MEQPKSYTIDIARVIRGKFGEKTPRWIISLARKLLHEDFLNEFFRRGYTGVEFCEKALEYMDITLQVEGLEKVPDEGLITVASNHPLGGHDALALVSLFGRKFDGNVRILVNDFLMVLKQLNGIFVPVNKVGSAQARGLSAQTDGIFHSDAQILFFPAGKCARRIDGRIQDPAWKKTFITKSVEYQRDVVPIHFGGQNSNFFYRLSGFCDKHIKKVNIAMLFLVDEMYKNVHKTFRVSIGKPIPWQTFDKSKTPAQWAQYVQDIVYQL